jgi:hypothetical protein
MPGDLADEVRAPEGAIKWNANQRELWIELFSQFVEQLVGSTIEEHRDLTKYPEEEMQTDIRVAAELADRAMQEVDYRFFKHPPAPRRREPRRRARR